MSNPKLPGTNNAPRWLAEWWPYLALALITVLFFWQYFLLDLTPFGGDTAFVFLPFRSYLMARLSHGELPLWNPYLFGGTPSTAEPQYQCWYVPNLLLCLLGVPRGMGWMFPLHLWLTALGTYLFTRRSLKLGRASATLAALAFAFGGCLQSRLINSPYVESAAWIPWILLAYDYASRRGGAALVLPGLALSQQLCTGAPQYTYYLLLLLPFYHWQQLRHNASDITTNESTAAKGRWLALGATVALGVLLTAAQLIPALELARLSERGTHATYAYVVGSPMAARHFFASLLFPKFWGSFSALPLDGYIPTVELSYLGAITLGLIAAALVAARARPQAVFWLLVVIVTMILAFGDNTPLYPLLYRWLPGTATFRTPAHWLVITSFAGALLAGMGMETILSTTPQARLAARVGLATSSALFVIGVALLISPWGAPAFQTPQKPFGSWGQVVILGLSALLFLPLSFKWSARRQEAELDLENDEKTASAGGLSLARVWPAVVLLLLTFDLFAVSQDMEMQHTVPVAELEKTPDVVTMMPTQPVPERFWAGDSGVPLEPWQMIGASPDILHMPADEFRARNAPISLALMPSCLATQYQRCGLTGVWGALMPMHRHAQPIYEPQTSLAVQRRWLRLLNVRYYLTLNRARDPQLELKSSDLPHLYVDPQPLPRAYIVNNARWVAGEQAQDIISSADFDPHTQVLLEPAKPQPSAPAPSAATLTPVQIISYTPEKVVLSCDAPQAGYLVLMDTPFPGWRATVDGAPAPIYPANWVGRGLSLGQGHHTIVMGFDSPSFRLGLFITLLTLGLCAGVITGACCQRGARSSS